MSRLFSRLRFNCLFPSFLEKSYFIAGVHFYQEKNLEIMMILILLVESSFFMVIVVSHLKYKGLYFIKV